MHWLSSNRVVPKFAETRNDIERSETKRSCFPQGQWEVGWNTEKKPRPLLAVTFASLKSRVPRYRRRESDIIQEQWFSTFFIYFTLLSNKIARFTINTLWCSFVESEKLTNSYSLEWFIKVCIGCNLWFSEFIPLEDEIYPRLRAFRTLGKRLLDWSNNTWKNRAKITIYLYIQQEANQCDVTEHTDATWSKPMWRDRAYWCDVIDKDSHSFTYFNFRLHTSAV